MAKKRILTEDDRSYLEDCANCKVSYTVKQTLTDAQKKIARDNIGVSESGGTGGGMSDADVQAAIEAALSEAKASGEFDGEDGQDGVSPTVNVSKVGKVTTITITDANGTKTATIKDGEDGSSSGGGTGSGEDGEDGIGIASIVQTTKSTADDGINIMTITLTDGSVHTFEVQNGSKGGKGDDGYTPQKGTDYFDGEDGADGVSCTHYWSGTTLYVTSASGTSYANLKGERGDDGSDYVLTDADKTEIAEDAAALVDAQLLSIIGEVS